MNNSSKNVLKHVSTQDLKERKAEILRALPAMDHIIRGSLFTRNIKCGKQNCHCANGEGHKSFYLSSFYHGHTGTDYVPAAWETWMREGIDTYGVIQDLLTELTELNLELFRRREKD